MASVHTPTAVLGPAAGSPLGKVKPNALSSKFLSAGMPVIFKACANLWGRAECVRFWAARQQALWRAYMSRDCMYCQFGCAVIWLFCHHPRDFWGQQGQVPSQRSAHLPTVWRLCRALALLPAGADIYGDQLPKQEGEDQPAAGRQRLPAAARDDGAHGVRGRQWARNSRAPICS